MKKFYPLLYGLIGLFITSELMASDDHDKNKTTNKVSQMSTNDKKEATEPKEITRTDCPVPKNCWDTNIKKDPDYYNKLMEKDSTRHYRPETESERRWNILKNMMEAYEEINGSGGYNEQGSGEPSGCKIM